MAAPHVVGMVALMWSGANQLVGNTHETMDIIQRTAIAKTTSQTCGNVSGRALPNNTFGYGMIDAKAAVAQAVEKYGVK
jgi:hypothetical protein